MKLFGGTTGQEKAISTLIHDHCNAESLVGSYINFAIRALEEPAHVERAITELKKAKEYMQKTKTVLDAYLEKAKNDFQ